MLEIGADRFKVPDVMFNPSIVQVHHLSTINSTEDSKDVLFLLLSCFEPLIFYQRFLLVTFPCLLQFADDSWNGEVC